MQTPYVVIDLQQVKKNIKQMQETANRWGCALRPHIKTHKSIEIAKMQLAAGASGITCATLSEAEVFTEAGIDDIFLAYPVVGEKKLTRAIALHKKLNRFIAAVDSLEGAQELSETAIKNNIIFETRIEIDTGAKRTGVPFNKLLLFGNEIRKLPGLHITGVFTFRGWVNNDIQTSGIEESRLLKEAADILIQSGLDIREISAGSTPTGAAAAEADWVNEIRPGTYVFNDWMNQRAGCCGKNDIAAFVMATVVSTPEPARAIIDAGCKTLAADVRLLVPPYHLPGFAYIVGNENLILDRLSEEHGMIRTGDGGETGLQVGDIVTLIPAHICTVVNLQHTVFAQEKTGLRPLTIDTRGMTW